MGVRAAANALYDSEALLRRVERELAELGAALEEGEALVPAGRFRSDGAPSPAVIWRARDG